MSCVYLSGPMTGLPEFNLPAFAAAAQVLRKEGATVHCPAEYWSQTRDQPRSFHLRRDVGHVLEADEVMVLAGWQASKGARLEVAIAQEIGTPVVSFDTREPVAHVVATLVP